MKTCSKCKQIKPITAFYKRGEAKGGYKSACKVCLKENPECKAARNKVWAAKNPGRYKEIQLKRKFGISLDEYKQMLTNQQERCAICRIDQSELKRQLAVDHCHQTGKIRGLLCDTCNIGLGSFKDSVLNLSSAVQYLLTRKT